MTAGSYEYSQVLRGAQDPATPPPILEIKGVRKTFASAGTQINALKDITFTARRGELICVLGRSGCGKSTLLKIIAGFLPSDSGFITLDGRSIDGPGPERCMVFQEDALFPWLTVRENIAFGLNRCDRREKRREVDRLLDLIGLREFEDFLPREISGGMNQRVALARVLILRPLVLLMDEPFASLDAQTREETQTLLLGLWQQFSHTILFVTHDVNEAVLLADRILLFGQKPGRIREEIPIDLPRPRDIGTESVMARCRDIRKRLGAE